MGLVTAEVKFLSGKSSIKNITIKFQVTFTLALMARIAKGNTMSPIDPSIELTNDAYPSGQTKEAVDRWRDLV